MELITIQELGTLTPTKTNIEVVSQQLASIFKNGNADPIEFAIRCKFAIEALEASLELVKEDVLKKIDKETIMFGAKVESAETGTKYDYSGNETWQNIDKQLKPLLGLKKEIEDKIKMATKINQSIIDENSGEIIASPVKKESTTSIKITLGK